MRINLERMRDSMLAMARIGATEAGGVTRLALTDEDKAARSLLGEWMAAAGLEVRVDDVGNMYGWRPGEAAGQPPILMGSHLDSVRQGGKFDGVLGVLAGLEVLRSMQDAGVKTRRGVGLVNWTAEEGSRFEPSILGSAGITGKYDIDFIHDLRDDDGKRFGDELQRIGYAGSRGNRPGELRAYLEMHIEQGPVLEQEGIQFGVVTGISGLAWSEVVLRGQADHAGPTPMRSRRDALMGASRALLAVRQIALDTEDSVVTVGRLQVEPNIINVIPDRVRFGLDFRHPDLGVLQSRLEEMRQAIVGIAEEERLGLEFHTHALNDPVAFNAEVVSTVEQAAKDEGITHRRLASGAGHDAQFMDRTTPTAMLFVPCKDGKSHCEEEEASFADIEAATNVLARAVLALAE